MIEIVKTNTEIIVTITKEKVVGRWKSGRSRHMVVPTSSAFPLGTKFSVDTDRAIPLKFKYPEGTNEK